MYRNTKSVVASVDYTVLYILFTFKIEVGTIDDSILDIDYLCNLGRFGWLNSRKDPSGDRKIRICWTYLSHHLNIYIRFTIVLDNSLFPFRYALFIISVTAPLYDSRLVAIHLRTLLSSCFRLLKEYELYLVKKKPTLATSNAVLIGSDMVLYGRHSYYKKNYVLKNL